MNAQSQPRYIEPSRGAAIFHAAVGQLPKAGISIYGSRVPAVRGYLVARGIGGISRNQFTAANSFREPSSDRQTYAGPFDHGFFFDSGTAPHGGDSPYLH